MAKFCGKCGNPFEECTCNAVENAFPYKGKASGIVEEFNDAEKTFVRKGKAFVAGITLGEGEQVVR